MANVAAFARLYGVVRYFYPGDGAQRVDWNRFAVDGVARVRQDQGQQALATTLHELFASIGTGIDIIPTTLPFPKKNASPNDQAVVYWQRLGYAHGINHYAVYQAKHIGRQGVFVPASHAQGVDLDHQRTATESLIPAETPLFPAGPPTERYEEFPLGAGLKARVPIVMADDEAKFAPAPQAATNAKTIDPAGGQRLLTGDERLADIVVSWNVYRHFYPYWAEVGVDWDGELMRLLGSVDAPGSREAQKDSLRHLVGLVKDGHGVVYDTQTRPGVLPMLMEPIGDALVVTASTTSDVQTGDRIVSINGVKYEAWADRELPLMSGSPQWQRWRLAGALDTGAAGTEVRLGLERGGRQFDLTLTYGQRLPLPPPARPAPVSLVADGVWYLDITRASAQDLDDHSAQFSQARALIVDLRGYPTPNTGAQLLRHLLAAPEHDHWMHLPEYETPFDRPVGELRLG